MHFCAGFDVFLEPGSCRGLDVGGDLFDGVMQHLADTLAAVDAAVERAFDEVHAEVR